MADLKNYENVKSRKKSFYKDYSDGRIIVDHVIIEKSMTVIKASVYRCKKDYMDNAPLATGYAQEFQGQGGMANRSSWTENCEESAVGRALDNAGYSTKDKCSREEMLKVFRHEKLNEKGDINNLYGKIKELWGEDIDKEKKIEIVKKIDFTKKDFYSVGEIEVLMERAEYLRGEELQVEDENVIGEIDFKEIPFE